MAAVSFVVDLPHHDVAVVVLLGAVFNCCLNCRAKDGARRDGDRGVRVYGTKKEMK